jgi:hypothetical protein
LAIQEYAIEFVDYVRLSFMLFQIVEWTLFRRISFLNKILCNI